MLAITASARKGAGITKAHVRFGSKADIRGYCMSVKWNPLLAPISSSIFQPCLGSDEIRSVKSLAKKSVGLAEL